MVTVKFLNGNIGVGLNAVSINRLKDGETILLKGNKLGIDYDIVLVYADTQVKTIRRMYKCGCTPENSIININGFEEC